MKITSHQINIKDQKDFLKEVLGEQSLQVHVFSVLFGFSRLGPRKIPLRLDHNNVVSALCSRGFSIQTALIQDVFWSHFKS